MLKMYNSVEESKDWSGPHPLDAETVARVPDAPGVYILSDTSWRGIPLACYIGRSDSLPTRLAAHVEKYSYFYFKTTETENGAFFTECRLFHKYGKARHLDNKVHPAVPPGSRLPPCSEAGCRGEAN